MTVALRMILQSYLYGFDDVCLCKNVMWLWFICIQLLPDVLQIVDFILRTITEHLSAKNHLSASRQCVSLMLKR